jgi:hypothetical protein
MAEQLGNKIGLKLGASETFTEVDGNIDMHFTLNL